MSGRLTKQEATVCVGRAAIDVGELTFVRDGRREYSAFAYGRSWLGHPSCFEISPDLPLSEGHITRRAATEDDSPFPAALADTEPDTWGKRIAAFSEQAKAQGDQTATEASQSLQLAWTDVNDRWRGLKEARDEQWDEARRNFESAWQRLQQAWEKAQARQ